MDTTPHKTIGTFKMGWLCPYCDTVWNPNQDRCNCQKKSHVYVYGSGGMLYFDTVNSDVKPDDKLVIINS